MRGNSEARRSRNAVMCNRNTTVIGLRGLRRDPIAAARRRSIRVAAVLAMYASILVCIAQQPAAQSIDGATISGAVMDSAGKPVAIADVLLESAQGAMKAVTDAAGRFSFSGLEAGTYLVSAEKNGLRSRTATAKATAIAERSRVDLVLNIPKTAEAGSEKPPDSFSLGMEFADKPNFTVSGVTDWTAAGGHGSDANLRASEALTRDALSLKSSDTGPGATKSTANAREFEESERSLRAALAGAPDNFEANRRLAQLYFDAGKYRDSLPFLEACDRSDPGNFENEKDLTVALKETGNLTQAGKEVQTLLARGENADLRRLAGEIDEKEGDPLAAVREFEQAVRQDPSEPNYFEWGSELLLHRAVWQAQEVFRRGSQSFPKSSRLLAALGAALFAGALYDEAALRLCDASDLSPTDPEPYLFMGKIVMAAPNPLPCVEQRLARFAQLQPGNSLAIYYHAISILKQSQHSMDSQLLEKVESMLRTAVTLDPQCGDAYLQLGILSYSQREFDKAIGYYLKAIEVNPQLSEAHYHLGIAYDRTGERLKARQEFDLHDKIEKEQAAEVERQRREVKQFLVLVPEPAAKLAPQ
jgi:tetratricopeptide (TPR) repeat protein